jgi:putative acetyltransferase
VRGAGRVRLRRATPADAAAIARVMRAAIRAERGGVYTARQLAAWSSLPALYHRWAMTVGRETYLVAERAGRIVGYAAVIFPPHPDPLPPRLARGETETGLAVPSARERRLAVTASVARREGELGREPGPAEVTAAFVHPAARGAGIGAALLARVEALARRRGATSLRVDAALGAVPFYRACGYAGRRRLAVSLPGGARLTALRLARAVI